MIRPTMAAQHHIGRFFWQGLDRIAGASGKGSIASPAP
jgi:hypothetical protein